MTEKELFKLCLEEFYEIEKVDIAVFNTFDGCYAYFRDRGKTDNRFLEDDYFVIQTPHLDLTVWDDGGMATLSLQVTVYSDRRAGIKAYSDILIDDIESEVESK